MNGRSMGAGWNIFTPPSIGADVVDLTRYYTKSEIQTLLLQMPYKESVDVATTGPISLGAPIASIDGYTLLVGSRVLVWQQIDPVQNGIFEYNGSSFTRSTDFSTTSLGPAFGINDIDGNGVTATITTASDHGLAGGEDIQIFDSTSYNGVVTVGLVTGLKSFEIAHPSATTDELGTFSLVLEPNVFDYDIAVPVENGNTHAAKIFNIANDDTFPIAIGTDPIEFAELFAFPGENYYTKAETLLLVQDSMKGLLWLDSVIAATNIGEVLGFVHTGNEFEDVTGGSGVLLIDGTSIPDLGRVLIKNQGTLPSYISDENGLYYFDQASDKLIRTTDFDDIGTEIKADVATAVNFGANNATSVWKMIEPSVGQWQWLYLTDSDSTMVRGTEIHHTEDAVGISTQLDYEANLYMAVKATATGSTLVLPEINNGGLVRDGWFVTIINDNESTQTLTIKPHLNDGHLPTTLFILQPGEQVFLGAVSNATAGNDRWMSSIFNHNETLVISGLDMKNTSPQDTDILIPSLATDIYVPLRAFAEVVTAVGTTVEPIIDLYANGNPVLPVFESKELSQAEANLIPIDIAANPAKITGGSAKLTLRRSTFAVASGAFTVNLYVKMMKLA